MPTSLDLPRLGESTSAASVPAQMMRAAQEEARRKAAMEARQEAEDARQEAQLKLSQQAGSRAQQEADAKQRAGTAIADASEWTQIPQYQVPWSKAPEEAKRHFSIDTYGEAAPNARVAWDASLRQQGIPIDQPGANEDITINPQGEATRRISAPPVSSAGQVTERDLAEKGLDPNKIPRSEWASALAAKLEPVKAKLDVQQKAALGAAAQSVPVLATAMQQYDSLNSSNMSKDKAGPIAGGIETLKSKFGMGSREFAKANAELRGNLFNVARSLQGAGVLTEMDMKRMEEIAPSLRQDRDQFAGQVDAVKGLMRERLEAWRELNASALDESQRALVDRLIEQTKLPADGSLPQAANPQPNQPVAPKEPTATNPKTGQKMVYRNGKWQPM